MNRINIHSFIHAVSIKVAVETLITEAKMIP